MTAAVKHLDQKSEQTTAIERLADFANSIQLHDVPPQVRRQAALSLLDTIGCMLAGSATAEAVLMRHAENLDHNHGGSTAIGTGLSVNSREAARYNGYLGDIFEMNDLTGGHASIGNVAAALALAEEVQASGAELLIALIAGIEVTARIYNALYPALKAYTECGMVPVGLPNCVGAAAAASRLLRLDAAQTRAALAIAAGLAGWCPAEVIFGNGSTLKPMLFGGWPASAGLLAGQYANAGMTGPSNILESPIGYFATVAAKADLTALEPAGWALEHPRRKLHACCGYIHAAADIILRLHEENPFGLTAAQVIRVKIPPYIMPAITKLNLPATANQARFDIRYCLALAASGHGPIIPAHSEDFLLYLGETEVMRAYNRIQIAADASLTHYHQATLSVEQADGSSTSHHNSAPKGSPSNPLSDEAVIAKYVSLAQPVLGTAAANEACSIISGIENFDTLVPLSVLLRGTQRSLPAAR